MSGLKGIPVLQMRYDTEEYAFRDNVEAILGPDLERLHCALGEVSLRRRENDQNTKAHQMFYESFDSEVATTYKRFIHEIIQPLFDEPIIYQRIPTFRAHLVGNRAVGEYHRDSDYNHNPEAVTFWLPVTEAQGSNSVQIELDGKMRAMHVPYGQVLIFDSVNLLHGNDINHTLDTRVSFDFRVIPESRFVPSEKESLNTHLKMDVGGYYER